MQPPEYTLDHAAEILGLHTDELIAAAECGKITLIYVIHRDAHAPGVQLSEGSAETYKVFIRNFAGDDGKMEQEYLPDTRLRIAIDPDRIHRIRAGDRVCKTSGRIYGNEDGFVWHGRVDVTLDSLRVPAEEIERITQRPRAAAGTGKQSDQQKSQTAKMSAPIKPRTRVQRNRAAVEAARAELLKEKHREPATDEVFFFLENDPSGTFVDVKNDTLLWEDSRGKTHPMTRKALGKMLSTIRNAA